MCRGRDDIVSIAGQNTTILWGHFVSAARESTDDSAVVRRWDDTVESAM